MEPHQTPETFDSALAQDVYDNTHHFILFDNKSTIAPLKGLMQVFREEVEIKKNIPRKVDLNIDTGETYLSPIYTEVINSDHYYLNQLSHIWQLYLICDCVLPRKRLAFKNAMYKLKNLIAIQHCIFIHLPFHRHIERVIIF